MKRLLLAPLLLGFIPSVNAQSYAQRQWKIVMDLNLNVIEFVKRKDYKAACIKQKQINELIMVNFEFFQEMAPTFDWFELREMNLDAEKDVCSKI